MGEGYANDRRGIQDTWSPTFTRIAQSLRNVELNPLAGPNMKTALPFTEVQVDGRLYRGEAWKKVGRIVLPDTGLGSTAAGRIAEANNLRASEPDSMATVCSFDAPNSSIGVALRASIRFGDNLALDKVKITVLVGGTQGVSSQSGETGRVMTTEQTLHLDLDGYVELNLRGFPGKSFKLFAESMDSECPHYIEGSIEGVLFPISILTPGGSDQK